MTSPQSERRSVSFETDVRVHILSPTPSLQSDLEEEMSPATDGTSQAEAYGISTLNNAAPHFFMHGPPAQTIFPSFFIPPTPLLGTIELPPTPPLVLSGLGPAFPLPSGTTSTAPTLGLENVPLLPRGELPLPVVWRLEQQWNVRDSGLPIGLPSDEPVRALCGIPEVVLHFTPHPLFPPFSHTLAVAPNADGKRVVTVGDLARAVQAALRGPLEGRVFDEQRRVLTEAQRCRRLERPPIDCRVDMWGPGRMFLRHLVSLSSAGGQGLQRNFAIQFQLI